MTKRRLLWLAYAACVLLAVFWGVRLLTPRHRINQESFEKIQVGMTLEEVAEIVGAPPGAYATGPFLLCRSSWKNCPEISGSLGGDQEWIGDEVALAVWLDSQKRVTQVQFGDVVPIGIRQETFFDKARAWLGLRPWDHMLIIDPGGSMDLP